MDFHNIWRNTWMLSFPQDAPKIKMHLRNIFPVAITYDPLRFMSLWTSFLQEQWTLDLALCPVASFPVFYGTWRICYHERDDKISIIPPKCCVDIDSSAFKQLWQLLEMLWKEQQLVRCVKSMAMSLPVWTPDTKAVLPNVLDVMLDFEPIRNAVLAMGSMREKPKTTPLDVTENKEATMPPRVSPRKKLILTPGETKTDSLLVHKTESLLLQVQKIDERAQLPQRGHEGDAGYDIAALEQVTISAGKSALLRTGLCIAIPNGFYGRLASRSGLAWKKHIDVAAGVIDAPFRGEVHVLLSNRGTEDYTVQAGDRIAQLIIEACYDFPVCQVDTLPPSQRGEDGLGSTGR